MSNNTRTSTHAAEGFTRLRKGYVEKPDTIIQLPGGETMTLRRRGDPDIVPKFRKFNPKKYDPKTGKAHGKGGMMGRPSTVPFGRFLLTAFIVHQAYHFFKNHVSRHLRAWRRRRLGKEGELVAADQEEWEEVESEEETEEVLLARRQLQASLLPAMMRNALPKPQRKNLAQRRAEAHRAHPRNHTTSRQMMSGPKGVHQRRMGLLERMDKAMQAHARALVMAEHQQQAHRQVMLEGAGQRQALPSSQGQQQQQQQSLRELEQQQNELYRLSQQYRAQAGTATGSAGASTANGIAPAAATAQEASSAPGASSSSNSSTADGAGISSSSSAATGSEGPGSSSSEGLAGEGAAAPGSSITEPIIVSVRRHRAVAKKVASREAGPHAAAPESSTAGGMTK